MTRVHVVDRAAFFGGDWPQGFVPFSGDAATDLLNRAHDLGRFEERAAAEATPTWKQWIPYCVLRCGSPSREDGTDPGDRGVFAVRRTKQQGETRLHGAWSIGIGGHVEPEDQQVIGARGGDFFSRALGRELDEELDLRRVALPPAQFLGLLNDDGTEVGRVHAGLVYVVDLAVPVQAAADLVGIREISKMEGGFTHLVEFSKLWQNRPQFESWSQILVRAGIAGPIGDCRDTKVGSQAG